MPCHVGDLACLRDLLDGVPTGLRIAEALLSDRLALALPAGCVLALACLIVMVGKICSLLYDDINGDEEWRQPPARQSSSRQTSTRQASTRKPPLQRTPTPQNRRTRGRSPTQEHEANRVQAESAQGAQPARLQAARPDVPPPGLPARRVEGPPHPEPVGASEPRVAVEAEGLPEGTTSSGGGGGTRAMSARERYAQLMELLAMVEPQSGDGDPGDAASAHAAVAPTANADTPPDEAPAQGHARTAQFTYLYARMMDNDRSPPPPPMLSARQSLSPAANVQGAGSRHGGAPIHKSSMKRSMSDQSLRIQGRQPVNQDQIHRSMRRSGSEASLSTNLKGPPRIKTPKPRARASAATQQGAVAPSPAISSSSRFYARVVRTQQEYFGCAQGTNQLFCCDLHQQQACPEEVSRNQRRHGITTQQAMRMTL